MEYNLAEMSVEMLMEYEEIIRMIRNQMLTDSDWTQLPDAPLSAEKKQEWLEYRTYLRNIPSQLPNPIPSVFTFQNTPSH